MATALALFLPDECANYKGSLLTRGSDEQPGSMFSFVTLEARVPADHPLRAIRRITDRAHERISPQLGALYIQFGRPSIPPEKLLHALLLQALFTIRSERQLMEQIDDNLLFRWFVGLASVGDRPRRAPVQESRGREARSATWAAC